MGDLREPFISYKSKDGSLFYKQHGHIEFYERLLEPYRNKAVVLVEIGIGKGGCLKMWKEYLGHLCKVYGLDKEDRLLYEDDGIKCFKIDQSIREEVRTIPSLIPSIDIFIDDGSHVNLDQIQTFEEVFHHLNPGGLYVVEDTQTSYRENYGGKYLKPTTFIEYCKSLIDSFYYTEDERISRNLFSDGACEIAFLNSMVTIRKR